MRAARPTRAEQGAEPDRATDSRAATPTRAEQGSKPDREAHVTAATPILVLMMALSACADPGRIEADAAPAQAGSTGIATAPPATLAAERIDAIVTAEHRRSAAEITAADQQSRDVGVRRAAARALARIANDAARPGLLRALADEDTETSAWGAYGLGFSCKGHEKETVSALVMHGLARSVIADAGAPPSGRAQIDPLTATARAVGRCAAEESEPTLVAWLPGPRDRALAAAYGLGDLSAVKQKLREETLVALLNLAAGNAAAPPLPEALFAIGRLENVPPTVVDRIREVATARLAEPGEGRVFAVRALSRGGPAGAEDLARVLSSGSGPSAGPGSAFTATERAEAVKSLKRLERAGQRALAEAIPGLIPSSDPVALTALIGDEMGVILAALDALDGGAASVPPKTRSALRELAALPAPPAAPATILRRLSWLRCAAAKAVAGENFREPLLTGCDLTGPATPELPTAPSAPATSASAPSASAPSAPAPSAPTPGGAGSIGARAVVEVIGRGEITGARLTAWRTFARGSDLRAREAALELLETHDEIEAADVLAEALAAKEEGLIATAATVIAKQPQRASAPEPRVKKARKRRRSKDLKEEPPKAAGESLGAPAPAIVKALLVALERAAASGGTDDLETLDSVIDAAGAIAVKEAKPHLDKLCGSTYPTVREHTAKALALITGAKVACEPPPGGGAVPDEIRSLQRGPVTLTFTTDVGELMMTLDPAVAPITVTRVAEIARAGYYRDNVVHRVVAGFVTQFGAPRGDGFGGPDAKTPLRCETSPIGFAPLTVGVALSGRDTGSSQLFVMHGRSPHLDGQYAWIGTATGPWASFVDGDRILEVKVSP